MYEDFAPKLAKLLTGYCQPIQHGDVVEIVGLPAHEHVFYALAEAIIKRGGHVRNRLMLPDFTRLLYEFGSDEQLMWEDPNHVPRFNSMDVQFYIVGGRNTRNYTKVPTARTELLVRSFEQIDSAIHDRMMAGKMRQTAFGVPTDLDAQEAGMSLFDYTGIIYRVCGLDQDDPVAFWSSMRAKQQEYIDWLSDKNEIHILGPDIDLTMSLAGRRWINDDGKDNLPGGEIFTGPVEDSVNGYVNFNMRAVWQGVEVDGIRLVYENGQIVEASATKGHDFLMSELNIKGARVMGEFAIGTNPGMTQPVGHPLYDEKIAGTIHMAVGKSYPSTGGVNESVQHWDMVHDMAESQITADGEVFYENGQFVI